MISKKEYIKKVVYFSYDILSDTRDVGEWEVENYHRTKEEADRYLANQVDMILNLQRCIYDVCMMTNEERKNKWKELKKSE